MFFFKSEKKNIKYVFSNTAEEWSRDHHENWKFAYIHR